MSKANFCRILKTIFLFASGIGGILFAFDRALDFQGNGAMWGVSLYTSIAWVASAVVLSLTAISLLRLTRVSWFWSIISGVVIMVMHSVFMTILYDFLGEVMRGWLFG